MFSFAFLSLFVVTVDIAIATVNETCPSLKLLEERVTNLKSMEELVSTKILTVDQSSKKVVMTQYTCMYHVEISNFKRRRW